MNEQNTFSLPSFPQVGTLVGWRLDLSVLCAQAKEPMEVMWWLTMVEHKDCTFEELSCVLQAGRYDIALTTRAN